MNPDEEVRLESSGHAMDCDERREYPRTQEYGRAELLVQLTSSSGEQPAIRAVLWDFSQGGLGMDVEQPLPVDAEVSILGELRGADYSVEFRADARIAHCRQIEKHHFRVGVAFLSVSYRRLAGGAEDTGETGETNWRELVDGGEPVVSTRKELHRLIDELPEEHLPEVGRFIRELQAEADQSSLGREALAAIEQGWDNFKASKTIRLDDLKEEPGL